MNSIAETITDIYSRLLTKSIDSKTLSYWVNGVKQGSMSIDTIKKSVIVSPEYRSKVETMFKQQYFELIGYEDVSAALAEFNVQFDDKEVAFEDIGRYIKDSEFFKQKMTEIIKASMSLVAGAPREIDVTPEMIDYYAQRFMKPDYTMELLQREIASGSRDSVMQVNKADEPIVPSYESHVSHTSIPVPPPTPTTIVVEKAAVLDISKLEMFEDVFERPMFVKEYFKYVVYGESVPEVFRDLAAFKAKHQSLYNKTRFLCKNYTGDDLSEWSYIDQYLMDIDNANFFEEYVEDIVASDEYAVAMKDMVNSWNMKLYDSNLDPNDIAYLFERVRRKKLHLFDDALVEEVKLFKAETDAFIENMFGAYSLVLGRQPDLYETNKFIGHYRDQVPLSSLERVYEGICNQLMQTLEFHDVVKDKIKDAWTEKKHATAIMPSNLYSCLKTVVAAINGATRMTDIDALIHETLLAI